MKLKGEVGGGGGGEEGYLPPPKKKEEEEEDNTKLQEKHLPEFRCRRIRLKTK